MNINNVLKGEFPYTEPLLLFPELATKIKNIVYNGYRYILGFLFNIYTKIKYEDER